MFGFFKRHDWQAIPAARWYWASSYRMCKKTGEFQKTKLSSGGWKTIEGKPVCRQHSGEWVMVRIKY